MRCLLILFNNNYQYINSSNVNECILTVRRCLLSLRCRIVLFSKCCQHRIPSNIHDCPPSFCFSETHRDIPCIPTTTILHKCSCISLPWPSCLIRQYITTAVDTKPSILRWPFYRSLHIRILKAFPTVSEYKILS
jgi:hypothetical protein